MHENLLRQFNYGKHSFIVLIHNVVSFPGFRLASSFFRPRTSAPSRPSRVGSERLRTNAATFPWSSYRTKLISCTKPKSTGTNLLHGTGGRHRQTRCPIHRALYNQRNFFITSSPPILRDFVTKKKIYYLLTLNSCYFSIMSKLNHLYSAEKILFVNKHIRNGGLMYWKPVRVYRGLCPMYRPAVVGPLVQVKRHVSTQMVYL